MIEVISGMLGSGTTYYTEYLNWLEGYKAAFHEHIYGVNEIREPKPRQKYEVSGFSFPHETHTLLVRDPRKVVRGLRLHTPHYQNYTEKYLGYRATTLVQYIQSYLDFTYMALDRDPKIIRIEDVPKVKDLRINATKRGTRKPYKWAELGSELSELAIGWGY